MRSGEYTAAADMSDPLTSFYPVRFPDESFGCLRCASLVSAPTILLSSPPCASSPTCTGSSQVGPLSTRPHLESCSAVMFSWCACGGTGREASTLEVLERYLSVAEKAMGPYSLEVCAKGRVSLTCCYRDWHCSGSGCWATQAKLGSLIRAPCVTALSGCLGMQRDGRDPAWAADRGGQRGSERGGGRR